MSPFGSGKYDRLCNEVLQKSGGRAAVVIVVESEKGSGMSVREDFSVASGEYHIKFLPKILRRIANEIERRAGITSSQD